MQTPILMKIQTWHANGKVNGRNFFLIDRLCVRKLSLQKQKHRDFLFYYAYAHNFVVDFIILGSMHNNGIVLSLSIIAESEWKFPRMSVSLRWLGIKCQLKPCKNMNSEIIFGKKIVLRSGCN